MAQDKDPSSEIAFDEDHLELIERRLTERVQERVEKILRWRYGTIFFIVFTLVSVFGYNIFDNVKEAAEKRLETFNQRLDDLKNRLSKAEELAKTTETQLVRVDELRNRIEKIHEISNTTKKQTKKAFNEIASLEDIQNQYLRKHTTIVLEEFGHFLGTDKPEAADFYEAVREFSDKEDFHQQYIYSTIQLAKVRANEKNLVRAWRLFDEAEKRAKKLGKREYVRVLLNRGETEADHEEYEKALFTLRERGLPILNSILSNGDDASLAGDLYLTIGNTHLYSENQDAATESYVTAASHFERAERFVVSAKLNRIVGYLLARNGDIERSKKYLHRAILMASYKSDSFELYQSNEALAELLLKQSAQSEAIEYICAAARNATGSPIFKSRDEVVRKYMDNDAASFDKHCNM